MARAQQTVGVRKLTPIYALGMGGGYYDRTLAYLRRRRHWRRPLLIGIAHECQRVEALTTSPWDVPLDMIATEARIYVRKEPP